RGGVRPGGTRGTGQTGGAPGYVRADSQGTQRPMIAPRDGQNARPLLDKLIAAKGGIERLRAMKNITATTRATGLGPNAQQGTIETVTYLEYPNRVRVESK